MTKLDILTVGNVAENNSTPPYYFYQSAYKQWGNVNAIDGMPSNYGKRRIIWNLRRLLQGKKKGGFQYSVSGCKLIEDYMQRQLTENSLLTFSQHIPLMPSILNNRDLYVYVDATLAGFNKGIGLDFEIPNDLKKAALAREKKVYQHAKLIFTRSTWARDSIIHDHGIAQDKVHVVYPGANLGAVNTFKQPEKNVLILGFVAKDWKRKGFEYLLKLAEQLQVNGQATRIKVIGELPKDYADHELVDYLGFIDKKSNTDGFVNELQGCHFGSLFSEKESLGISNLEFLRCGVPIIGFDHQGIADTLNPNASIGFNFDEDIEKVAKEIMKKYQCDYSNLRAGAEAISPHVTWDRATCEIMDLIEGRTVELFSIKHFTLKNLD